MNWIPHELAKEHGAMTFIGAWVAGSVARAWDNPATANLFRRELNEEGGLSL